MGIPSYFSHIVREYGDIIKKYNKKNMQIDNLYMDSNSIIYDSLFSLLHTYDGDNEKFEKKLIESIIIKIEDYIGTIEPRNCLFIAFDGVIWPGRLLGFAMGMLTFAVCANVYLGEGLTTKTIVSLILATILF